MATLRCPMCGASYAADKRPPPLCGRCKTTLRRCRYCAHLDQYHMVCSHLEVRETDRDIIEPDNLRHCPYFRFQPPSKATRKLAGLSWLTWKAVVTLLVMGALAYIGMHQYYNTVGPGETLLQLRLQPLGTVEPDEPFDLAFAIYNQGKVLGRHVTLSLGQDAQAVAEVVSSDPPAQQWGQQGTTLLLDYGELKAGNALMGRLTMRPVRRGNCHFQVIVSGENVPRPQKEQIRLEIIP